MRGISALKQGCAECFYFYFYLFILPLFNQGNHTDIQNLVHWALAEKAAHKTANEETEPQPTKNKQNDAAL